VVPGGPADQAGLRGSSSPNQPVGGDVIVAVDGNPIASFDDVLAYIGSRSPGDQVTLTIVRGGQQQDVVVTLQERQRQTQQDRSPLFP
jgi:S1-C subfamily serine protease